MHKMRPREDFNFYFKDKNEVNKVKKSVSDFNCTKSGSLYISFLCVCVWI